MNVQWIHVPDNFFIDMSEPLPPTRRRRIRGILPNVSEFELDTFSSEHANLMQSDAVSPSESMNRFEVRIP